MTGVQTCAPSDLVQYKVKGRKGQEHGCVERKELEVERKFKERQESCWFDPAADSIILHLVFLLMRPVTHGINLNLFRLLYHPSIWGC